MIEAKLVQTSLTEKFIIIYGHVESRILIKNIKLKIFYNYTHFFDHSSRRMSEWVSARDNYYSEVL